MNATRVTRYWRGVFDVGDLEFTTPGILVRENSGEFTGRSAAWIFVHGDCCLLSVPSDWVESTRKAVAGLHGDSLLTSDAVHRLFPRRVKRTVGPSYQGYVERPGFRPSLCEKVCLLSGHNRPALERLRAACSSQEWAHSGLDFDREPLFGYLDRREILAVSGVIPWGSFAANIGLLTHPASRGRGCGTAVASAAMDHVLAQGSVVLYQTLLENRAAVGIATTLGCQEYARMMFVDLDTDESLPGL